LWALVFLSIASETVWAQPIVLGQKDDFQNGTLQNWTNGFGAPDPVNEPNGGPAGAADRFLHDSSQGGIGAGSRLVVFNISQWTGDYLSAGVTQIEMDLKNLTSTTLDMRWALRASSGGSFVPGYVSSSPVVLPNDGLWHHAVFLLDDAHLTPVNSPAPLSTFLASVGEARILHSVTPSLTGDVGVFSFGVDNILAAAGAAVPEPAVWILLGLAASCAGAVLGVRMSRAAPTLATAPETPAHATSME